MCMFVCMCVCLSVCEHIFRTTRAIFTKFLCMLPVAMARPSSGGVTKSQGEGAILGVFFPTENALYSRAFGTHTKTAEPIEMPFGMKTRVGPRNHVLDGGADPLGEEAIIGGCPDHSKVLAIFRCSVVAAFAAKGIIQSSITSCSRSDHSVYQASASSILTISGRRRSGLSATKGAVGLHSVGEV